MSLNDLRNEMHKAAKEKGFWKGQRNVGELLMLIVSELGEGIEAHRKKRYCDMDKFEAALKSGADFKTAFETHVKDTFEDEMADALIRILDLCGGFDINIQNQVTYKLKYNQTREQLHGKSY